MRLSLIGLAAVLLAAGSAAGQALSSRVLVIYNSSPAYVAESQDVALDYQTKRGIPAGNVCGVPFGNDEQITLAAWGSTHRAALRACLDAAGRTNILYVVMSYRTPFRLVNGAQIASLDSYIADIWDAYSANNFPSNFAGNHRYYADAQTLGNYYPAFQTLAAYRLTARSSLIYSVWRLDAASVALAKGLVTKALAAEAAGGVDAAPGGTAYVDRRYADSLINFTPDFSYYTGDHDLNRMAEAAQAAGLTVVKDTNDAEIGVSPAPLTAPNAILYSGWYTLLNYNNVFTWRTGAVGWHLDSGSATHPRSGPSWSAQALQNGITVTSGAITEPGLGGLAHPDVVTRHLLQGGNVGDAFLRGTAGLKWMILNFGDPLYVPFPGGRAMASLPGDSLLVSPVSMISGTATITLTLKDPAPVGGITVQWSNNWTPFHVTALPATTTIAEGQRTSTVSFTVTNPVANPNDFIGVMATATYASKSIRNSVTVTSLLAGIAVSSGWIQAGTGATGYVVLNTLAPLGGTPVQLTSSHPAILTVPASMAVPAGAQVGGFPISTVPGSVAAPVQVTITAVSGAFNTTRVVTVVP